jgi:hypothetical protein
VNCFEDTTTEDEIVGVEGNFGPALCLLNSSIKLVDFWSRWPAVDLIRVGKVVSISGNVVWDVG